MFEQELTVAVLSPTEQLLGFLHPNYVKIEETSELYSLRNIKISIPLTDDSNNELSKYDKFLTAGNKIWRSQTCDGVPCLYVILGEKEYDYLNNSVSTYAEEVATELSQNQIFRNNSFSWTVNEDFINTYFGDLFEAGILTGPITTTTYSGALTPLSIIRKIEENGGEFNFRYSYDGKIHRYIDFLPQIGTTHNTPIELGYNTSEITLTINEQDTRIAAAPIGEPNSNTDNFHAIMKAFEDASFDINTQIPLYVTKDDNGNEVSGPLAYPPYSKQSGQNYIECTVESELVASYQKIHNQSLSSTGTFPRIYTFETNEENIYNIYWACIEKIRQYLQPEISIDCKIVDVQKLQGNTSEHYNIGDTVFVRLPGRLDVVEARILKTIKNPRDPTGDDITIGNYRTNFTSDFFKTYYNSAGNVKI